MKIKRRHRLLTMLGITLLSCFLVGMISTPRIDITDFDRSLKRIDRTLTKEQQKTFSWALNIVYDVRYYETHGRLDDSAGFLGVMGFIAALPLGEIAWEWMDAQKKQRERTRAEKRQQMLLYFDGMRALDVVREARRLIDPPKKVLDTENALLGNPKYKTFIESLEIHDATQSVIEDARRRLSRSDSYLSFWTRGSNRPKIIRKIRRTREYIRERLSDF